jgi:hypothetical protein
MSEQVAKWSPGPWSVESNYHDTSYACCALISIKGPPKSDAFTGCMIGEAAFTAEPNGFHVDSRAEAEANARIMAAAPELVDLLQKFADPNYYYMPTKEQDAIRAKAATLLNRIRSAQ